MIGCHKCDLRFETTVGDAIEQILQRGAAGAEKNGQADRWFHDVNLGCGRRILKKPSMIE